MPQSRVVDNGGCKLQHQSVSKSAGTRASAGCNMPQIGRWTLRFQNNFEEEGYVRYNFKSLVYSLRACAIFALFVSCWFFFRAWFAHDALEPRWPRLQMWGCFVVLAISVIACMSSAAVLKIPPVAFESLVVAFCCALIPCVYVMILPIFCYIFGFDCWQPVFARDNPDAMLLLGLDILVTASHVILPIRWCVLWPLEVLAVLSYFWRLLALPAVQSRMFTSELVLLALVVILCGYGKRANERSVRRNFKNLIHERTLRCEAENTLSKLSLSSGTEHAGSADDSDASLPTTTPTGRMFVPDQDVLDSQRSTQDQLQQILQLGIQEHWLIRSEDVQVNCDDVLGVGSYGLVAAGCYYGSPVAVKMALQTRKGEAVSLVTTLNELRILRQIRHTNLVLFHGACINIEREDLYLVLEQIDGFALDAFLMQRREDVTSGRYRYKVLLDVSCALRYLHSRRPLIVHSDLKASNVLVVKGASTIRAKLCDFGFSRLTTRSSVLAGGTLSYMAPEIICNSRTPSAPVDTFSFGRLIYFVSTSKPPYAHLARKAFVASARLGSFPPLVWPADSWALDDCKSLAKHCLSFTADQRPTMDMINETLRHTWQGWNSNGDSPVKPFMEASSYKPLMEASDYLRSRFASRVGKERKPKDVPEVLSPKSPKTSADPQAEHPQWLAAIILCLDSASLEMPVRTCHFCFTATNSMPRYVSVCLPSSLSQWLEEDELVKIGKNVKGGMRSTSIGKDSVKSIDLGPVVLSTAVRVREVSRVIIAKDVSAVLKDRESIASSSDSLVSLTLRNFIWGETFQESRSASMRAKTSGDVFLSDFTAYEDALIDL